MKILKIRFKNINSLRGEHQLDFTTEPLAGSGLFAITGPTGAGKTTILDVITLALFNRVPRLPKSLSKNLVASSGALITRNTEDAYALVEYECSKGIFQSSWEISVNRNGNLRDYHMEVANLQIGERLDLKKGEVPGENEKLIGLSYDQFVKSILLAQGEFAQFLKVDKNERGALLEKITGTGIYRQLGMRAFQKKQELAKELEKLREKRGVFSEKLLPEEVHQEISEEHARQADALVTISKKLKQLETQQQLRKELAKLQEESSKLEKDLARVKEAQEAFAKTHQQKLKRHEATAPFAESLQAWENRRERLQNLEEERGSLTNRQQKLMEQQKTLRAQLQTFIQEERSDDELLEALETFRQKVEQKDRRLEEIRGDYKSHFNQLKTYGEGWGYQPDVQDPQGEWQTLHAQKQETDVSLKKLAAEWPKLLEGDLETRLDELQEQELSASRGEALEAELKKTEARIQKATLSQKELQPKIEKLPTEIEKLELKTEKNSAQLEKLRVQAENRKLRASLEEHRANLKEGEPCPLCGSTEHPWAEHAPVESDHENEKQELESVGKQLQKERQQKHSELIELKSRLQQVDAQLAEARPEHAQQSKEYQAILKKWAAQDVNWEDLREAIKKERQAVKDFEKKQQQSKGIANCLPVLNEMITQTEEGRKLRKERKELYRGEDVNADCAKLRDDWQNLQSELRQQKQRLKENAETVEKQKAQQKEAEQKLAAPLLEADFDSPAKALAARLSDAYYLRLSQQATDLKSQVAKLETQQKSVFKSIDEKKEKLSEASDEEVGEQLQELQREEKIIREELNEFSRQLKNHQENLQEVSRLNAKIKEEEKFAKKWEILNELIGDATGKKFNNFAQDLTLQQLLLLANKRLAQLSDRYRVDAPQAEEDDSLVAVDEHMGGQRRSVKTLSGGETFVLSLSLALALSDLASKNVEINSLFIDEGFGTLDPETLDTTLDTLERLQAEGSKTIGIISHVEALKERISTQIQLERNGQGYSKITVKG
jgi:exonuclease SbcC